MSTSLLLSPLFYLKEGAPAIIEAIGKPAAFKAWAQGQHSAEVAQSNSQSAKNTAATHEFAHRLREADPQSYNEVQALIVGAMDSTEFSRGIDTRMDLYSGVVDAQPSAENMTEEVIGDALGQLLGNKEFYKSLPPQHRNGLQKLADFSTICYSKYGRL